MGFDKLMMDKLIENIIDFGNLEIDWDGYNAIPSEPKSILNSIKLLN